MPTRRVYRKADWKTPTDEEIKALQAEMEASLVGKNPLLQGVVLADLVAKYFAGHNPALRETSIDIWIATMRDLVKHNEKMLEHLMGNIWGRPEH